MRTKTLDDFAITHSIVKWPHYYFSTSFHNQKYAVSMDGFMGLLNFIPAHSTDWKRQWGPVVRGG